MLSNKDIRIENGYIIINGEKYAIVQDVSDITEDIEALGGRVTALEGEILHIAGETSITIPLSDTYTACIFGTISVTPISAILTVVTGGTVDVTDLTSNSLATRADITVDLNEKTLTITSKNTDKFYVNILC